MTSHSAKRTKATIGLALVLCLLLAGIAWMEVGGRSSGNNNDATNNIIISRAGHPDIQLALENDQWQMIAPYSLSSNEQRVTALTQLPNSLGQQYSLDEVTLSDVGLDTPKASVQINDTVYLLGNTDISGDRRYVRVDDKMSLVPEWVWSLVHGGVTAFADLNVFDELPDSFVLFDSTSDTTHPATNQAQWLSLTADKIVPWEYDSVADAMQAESAQHLRLGLADDDSVSAVLADIFRLEDYSVIQTEAGFGYAVSHARLDALINEK